ncbi:MAG: enoyl-CoA hydratase family protein [Planctomycetota bacterium]|nr:enoyl-CoA hydratase family protein [Planctomycetota bacterium]
MAQLPFGYEIEDGVATITLDRPDKLNALTFEVYRRLADMFYRMRFSDEVRACIITGSGKGFCGGGDVQDIIAALFERDTKEVIAFTRMTGELIENIRRMDRPVIAALNGTAAGAGAVIALACDLRVMADTAKIHFLFSKVGLTGADMGAAWLLPRVVGLGRASEWLLLGDGIDARTAHQAGLVTKVVAPDKVLEEAQMIARRLADGPTLAHSMTKRLLNGEMSMDFSSAIESEAVAQALLLRARDHREFYDAWAQGRAPKFEGR